MRKFKTAEGTTLDFPESLTQAELIEDDTLMCTLAVSHRTGISVKELLSNTARQWFDLAGDFPASHIRWEIGEAKKNLCVTGRTRYGVTLIHAGIIVMLAAIIPSGG
jgi:hypothetical protein